MPIEEEAVDKVMTHDEPETVVSLDASSETVQNVDNSGSVTEGSKEKVNIFVLIIEFILYIFYSIGKLLVKTFKKIGEGLVMCSIVFAFIFAVLGVGCGMFSVLFPMTNELMYESNYELWLGFTIAAGATIALALLFSSVRAAKKNEPIWIGFLVGGVVFITDIIVVLSCGFNHAIYGGSIAVIVVSGVGIIISGIANIVADDGGSIFSVGIAVCVLALVPCGITYAVTEHPNRHLPEKDGFYYLIREDNTLTVFAENFDTEELVVPSEINGYRVTAVARPKSMKHKESLKSVTIPNSVFFIEDGTFKDCTELKSVRISQNLLQIGDKAFYNCRALEAIELPLSLKSVGESAFENCISLAEIDVPSNISVVAKNAFKGCAKLVSANINTEIIDDGAFSNCSALTSVTLSDGVTKIGSRVFAGDIVLKHIYIPRSVEIIKEQCFANCISLTAYFGHSASKWELDDIPMYFNITRSEYEQTINGDSGEI